MFFCGLYIHPLFCGLALHVSICVMPKMFFVFNFFFIYIYILIIYKLANCFAKDFDLHVVMVVVLFIYYIFSSVHLLMGV